MQESMLIAICSLIVSVEALPFRIDNVRFSTEQKSRPDGPRRERVTHNVTTLLNHILEGYDRHLRPEFNGILYCNVYYNCPILRAFTVRRTTVFIDIFVRTMGPIADLTNTYSFNCYFRQTWTDSRLKYNGTAGQELLLSMAMLDKIWKPDTTHLCEENVAQRHGSAIIAILYVLKEYEIILGFTNKWSVFSGKCAMMMNRYPLDKQVCRLIIGSYAFGSDELLYDWRVMGTDRGVQMDYEGISDLAQFSMTGFKVFNATNMTRDRECYLFLGVSDLFGKTLDLSLFITYHDPISSFSVGWSFWTNREATGDRVGMGITSVLTMVLIANDTKSDAPKVSFPTALDVYIWICYTTLLLCMVEFTVVHYFTKFNTGDPEIQAIERERMRRIIRKIPKTAVLSTSRRMHRHLRVSGKASFVRKLEKFAEGNKHKPLFLKEDSTIRTKSSAMLIHSKINTAFFRDSIGWRLYFWMINNAFHTDPFGLAENSISTVDRFARIALPIYFVAVVTLYYNFYINTPYHFQFEDDTDIQSPKLGSLLVNG
ncbi:Neurotransmitter-gated ion-channel ligand binding domain protein [Teladorsagia circumcincta]|uniref:Neurotransmitter-gated ion-channel ligand binding domain protein n=1 Tax=Teladorsagia circumcincta TaxID=45464 RepID=A0A2G9UGV4_TELCI|nr:Neurotransmitter-gated ion-channel ligand binding domain protein [Teladorsagia circumcincta]